MKERTLAILFLLIPFIAGAPTEEKLPYNGLIELNDSMVPEPEGISQSNNASKAAVTPPTPPPQITIPLASTNIPLVFPRPFSISFPFSFPPLPKPPNLQFIAIPRSQKKVQVNRDDDDNDDDDDDDDDDDVDNGELEVEEIKELVLPVELSLDSMPDARRAPISTRRKKKQKKPKKQKKQKKKRKQKKQKRPKYPQPIIIYQNQEEQSMGNENVQPGVSGAQGAQGALSSYQGYYMVYVVEVRWTGNNYTQTVVTGRPIPAAITIPSVTDSGLVNNLSETIMPANLVNGNRPQTTPTCLFQRSTTTEHFGTQPEIYLPVENPIGDGDEVNEQIGEEVEESEDLDSIEDDYEDESDPKKKIKKKKKVLVTSSTDSSTL